MNPRLSMVCITNRPCFSEAVWTQFQGQTYPNKELVVIDSSDAGGVLQDRADVYVRAEPGTWVGPMRNLGVKAARGDWIMWFDDDDWRHPDFAANLMDLALKSSSCIAGLNSYCWIDVDGKMSRRCCGNWPVFAASVYRHFHDFPLFREKPKWKTDSYWIPRMRERGQMALLDYPEWYVYVYHGANVHNRDLMDNVTGRETDKDFLPSSTFGLPRHMEIIREGVMA